MLRTRLEFYLIRKGFGLIAFSNFFIINFLGRNLAMYVATRVKTFFNFCLDSTMDSYNYLPILYAAM